MFLNIAEIAFADLRPREPTDWPSRRCRRVGSWELKCLDPKKPSQSFVISTTYLPDPENEDDHGWSMLKPCMKWLISEIINWCDRLTIAPYCSSLGESKPFKIAIQLRFGSYSGGHDCCQWWKTFFSSTAVRRGCGPSISTWFWPARTGRASYRQDGRVWPWKRDSRDCMVWPPYGC